MVNRKSANVQQGKVRQRKKEEGREKALFGVEDIYPGITKFMQEWGGRWSVTDQVGYTVHFTDFKRSYPAEF